MKKDQQGVQAFLKLQQKLAANRNNPFSEHSTAMDKLTRLNKDRPERSTPIPDGMVIRDINGRVVG